MSKFPQAPFARAPFGECRSEAWNMHLYTKMSEVQSDQIHVMLAPKEMQRCFEDSFSTRQTAKLEAKLETQTTSEVLFCKTNSKSNRMNEPNNCKSFQR